MEKFQSIRSMDHDKHFTDFLSIGEYVEAVKLMNIV